jgi:hypothetical protein
MKNITKIALGAALLGASVAGFIAPAEAGISVGIGIGVPGVWYGPPGPCAGYRYYYGTPWASCGYWDYDEPIFVDGYWYHGPFYYRWWHGERQFWFHGGWRVNEWHGGPGGWHGGVHWGDHGFWHGGHWDHPGWGHPIGHIGGHPRH